MSDNPEKKWRRRSDARPLELVKAALVVFSEQGFAAAKLSDVASHAGVSKATIYRYFENKEALFEAAVEEAIAPRFAEAQMLVDAYEGSSTDLLRMFFRIARAALAGPFPALLKLILSESGNFPKLANLWVDLAVLKVTGLVATIIERGIARGEFRQVDPKTTAPLVMAPVFLLGVWKQTLSHTAFQLQQDELLDAHLEMLILGLKTQQTGGSCDS